MGRGPDKKPRKKRQDNMIPANNRSPSLPEGYNTQRLSMLASVINDTPFKDPDVQQRWDAFKAYVKMCADNDMKVGNQAAYMAAGIDAKVAYEWENRRGSAPDRADLIKRIKQFCAVYREYLSQDGKINPVISIFWSKNYDGLRDQQEVVVTPNQPLGESPDMDKLKQTYLENTYGVVAEQSDGGTPKTD